MSSPLEPDELSDPDVNVEWTKGNTGKGILYPGSGGVRTWITDEYEWPHHGDIDPGVGFNDGEHRVLFQIDPSGIVNAWHGHNHLHTHEDTLKQHNSDLTVLGDKDWDFTYPRSSNTAVPPPRNPEDIEHNGRINYGWYPISRKGDLDSKVGSERVPYLFHVAPVSARESILRHGLDPTRGQKVWENMQYPQATYLHSTLMDAADHGVSGPGMRSQDCDIWAVDASKVQTEDDPLAGPFSKGNRMVRHPIPPEHIEMVPDEYWHWAEEDYTDQWLKEKDPNAHLGSESQWNWTAGVPEPIHVGWRHTDDPREIAAMMDRGEIPYHSDDHPVIATDNEAFIGPLGAFHDDADWPDHINKIPHGNKAIGRWTLEKGFMFYYQNPPSWHQPKEDWAWTSERDPRVASTKIPEPKVIQATDSQLGGNNGGGVHSFYYEPTSNTVYYGPSHYAIYEAMADIHPDLDEKGHYGWYHDGSGYKQTHAQFGYADEEQPYWDPVENALHKHFGNEHLIEDKWNWTSSQEGHGWEPQEHDYDPEWDYALSYEHFNHPLVQQAQERLNQLAERPDTPMNPERPGRVFPADLSKAGPNPTQGDSVAVYCNGTYNEPCILFDPEAHRGYEDQVHKTIDHEVAHAIQDWEDNEADEDQAESWHFGNAGLPEWKPGQRGKGIRTPDGSIHVWGAHPDFTGMIPHHGEAMMKLNIPIPHPGDDQDENDYFHIEAGETVEEAIKRHTGVFPGQRWEWNANRGPNLDHLGVPILRRGLTAEALANEERPDHGDSWPLWWNGAQLEVGPHRALHLHTDWTRSQWRDRGTTGRLYQLERGPRIEWHGPDPFSEGSEWHWKANRGPNLDQQWKGFVLPDGSIKMWPVDDEGYPHHSDGFPEGVEDYMGSQNYAKKFIPFSVWEDQINIHGYYDWDNPKPKLTPEQEREIYERAGIDPDDEDEEWHWEANRGPNEALANGSHIAGMTKPQRLKAIKAIPWEDRSDVVHSFSNGWTINKLNYHGDQYRDGLLLHTCWAPGRRKNHNEPLYNPEKYDYPDGDTRPHTLRDEVGYPRVAFFVDPEKLGVFDLTGHGNDSPKYEYLRMIQQWANKNQIPLSSDFNDWLEHSRLGSHIYGTNDPEEVDTWEDEGGSIKTKPEKPKLVHLDDIPAEPSPDWIGARNPFAYHIPTNTVYVGPLGTHHLQMPESEHFPISVEDPNDNYALERAMISPIGKGEWLHGNINNGWEEYNPRNTMEPIKKPGGVRWWRGDGSEHDHVLDWLAEKYGVPNEMAGSTPGPNWKWGAGGRLYGEDETPPEWTQGQYGRGILRPDGITTWVVDETGSPHHPAMSEGEVPIYLNPDGTAAGRDEFSEEQKRLLQEHGFGTHPQWRFGSYLDTLEEHLGPEVHQEWWNDKDVSELPSHVYRAMSENHFQQSLKDGFHQSDERGNYIGQGVSDEPEGTVANRWAHGGYLTNAEGGAGRIVKIRVHPEDGWENHPDDMLENGGEGGYVRTFKPIPVDRFEAWTPPINTKSYPWEYTASEDHDWDWPHAEPHVTVHQPQGFEYDASGRRIPFIYALHPEDRNDVNVFLGQPGAIHAEIGVTHPYWHDRPGMYTPEEMPEWGENWFGTGAIDERGISFFATNPEAINANIRRFNNPERDYGEDYYKDEPQKEWDDHSPHVEKAIRRHLSLPEPQQWKWAKVEPCASCGVPFDTPGFCPSCGFEDEGDDDQAADAYENAKPAPTIHEHETMVEDHPWPNDRWPTFYDPDKNEVHIGSPGGHHLPLAMEAGLTDEDDPNSEWMNKPMGYIVPHWGEHEALGNQEPGTVNWFHKNAIPKRVDDALLHHVNNNTDYFQDGDEESNYRSGTYSEPEEKSEQWNWTAKTAGDYDFYDNRKPSWEESNYVEWMHPRELWPYREYDRDLSRHDDLREHWKQHGLKEPIKLMYDQDSGYIHVGEGNHRLKMALEEGHQALPVQVHRSPRTPEGNKGQKAPQMIEPDRFGYVPGMIRPSEVGLPIVPQPVDLGWPHTSAVPNVIESQGKWPDDFQGALNLRDDDPDTFKELEENWQWRRPWVYDPRENNIYLGQPGTHHENMEEEFGLGLYGPEERLYDKMPTGYVGEDPKGLHTSPIGVYYGESYDNAVDALHEHLGIPKKQETWKFAGIWDEPISESQELHPSFGWEPGKWGKGYYHMPDGDVQIWNLNERYGDIDPYLDENSKRYDLEWGPHHADVMETRGHAWQDCRPFNIFPDGMIENPVYSGGYMDEDMQQTLKAHDPRLKTPAESDSEWSWR